MDKLFRTHRGLFEDYLMRQTKIGGSISHVKKLIGYTPIRDDGFAPPFAFRINSPPIFHLYMDHAVSRFRRLSKDYSSNLNIFYERGYMPCYCPTLDVFSMIHLYDKRSKIADTDSQLSTDAWEVSEGKGSRSTYSSINSFLVQKDYVTNTSSILTDLLSQYLDRFFWSYPCRGFTCSPQIVPDKNRIRFVYKTTKTLFSFQGLVKKWIYTRGRDYDFTAAKLKGVVYDTNRFVIRDFVAICLPETADKLRKMKHKYVINGVVTEFIRPNIEPFYTLTLVSDLVDTYHSLLANVFGMIASRAFYNNDSICVAGETEDLKQKAEDLIDLFGNHVSLPRTISSDIENPWEWVSKLLSPIFTMDSDTAYCLHPLHTSSLELLQSAPFDVNNSEMRLLLLKILQISGDTNERFSSIKEVRDLSEMGIPSSELGTVISTIQSYMPFVKALKRFY